MCFIMRSHQAFMVHGVLIASSNYCAVQGVEAGMLVAAFSGRVSAPRNALSIVINQRPWCTCMQQVLWLHMAIVFTK